MYQTLEIFRRQDDPSALGALAEGAAKAVMPLFAAANDRTIDILIDVFYAFFYSRNPFIQLLDNKTRLVDVANSIARTAAIISKASRRRSGGYQISVYFQPVYSTDGDVRWDERSVICDAKDTLPRNLEESIHRWLSSARSGDEKALYKFGAQHYCTDKSPLSDGPTDICKGLDDLASEIKLTSQEHRYLELVRLEMTNSQIAKMMSVTRPRVTQLKKSVIRKARTKWHLDCHAA